jgi:hypothetical protein
MAPRGFGKPGFCKICAHEAAPRLIKAARDGLNAAQAQEIASVHGLTFNRQTWYEHRKHAQTAGQRVVQAAEKVRREGALTIRDIQKHDNTTVLEAIRDLGMARALENPEDVTVDQALKAASILEQRKDRGGDQLNILVAFVTGTDTPTVVVERKPAEVIEGTAQEIA